MAKSVFIIGTSHFVQCGVVAKVGEARICKFQSELRGVCSKFGIQRAVEEMSREGLERYGVEETVCQTTLKDICIQHVDLNEEERRNLSIDDWFRNRTIQKAFKEWISNPKSCDTLGRGTTDEEEALCRVYTGIFDEVRERIWVVRTLAQDIWPLLFICGASHCVPISRLFQRFGVETTIVHYDFS